jgi:hypothetical protein
MFVSQLYESKAQESNSVAVMNEHVSSESVNRVEMVMLMQLQLLQLALNVRQLMGIKYVELVNDDVRVVHVHLLIVWFHGLKELDQYQVDLE